MDRKNFQIDFHLVMNIHLEAAVVAGLSDQWAYDPFVGHVGNIRCRTTQQV